MAYRIHYSDYPGTAEGPPDPERWVGPPGPVGPMGPMGPQGPQGIAGNPFPEAPSDGAIYGRGGSTVAWVPTLPIAGGALIGPLLLAADPTAPLGAATMRWVQSSIGSATAGGPFLPLATGGTVAGPTTFSAAGTGLTVTNTAAVQGALSVGTGTATNPILTINGAKANQRRIEFMTGGSLRWRVGESATDETGGNAGSDFYMNAFSDTGSLVGGALTLTRADMQLQLIKLRIGGAATINYSGAPTYNQCPLAINYNYAGSTDHSGWLYLNYLGFVSDVVDPGSNQQAIGLGVLHYFGGAGFTGSRSGFRYQLSQTGPAPGNGNYQAGLFTADVSYSSGGTDLWSNAAGVVFGGAAYSAMNSGATNYRGEAGFEIDYGIASGATAAGLNGLQLFRWSNHTFQPPNWENDNALVIGSQAFAAGAKFGINFTGSEWPIDRTNGRIMGAGLNNQWNTAHPQQAAHGIDFYNVNLTGTAFRAQGFSVLGTGGTLPAGTVQIGNAYLSSSATQTQLDVVGYRCTGGTIASGGSALIAGDALVHDASGLVFAVSSVDASGVVTGITWVSGTGYALTPPTNPVTMRVSAWNSLGHTNGAPVAPTLNLTWTQTTTLALNPSGGPVAVNAGCTLTSGSAAPASTQPAGSIYMRTGGASGARLYVSAGAGAWNAVAGV